MFDEGGARNNHCKSNKSPITQQCCKKKATNYKHKWKLHKPNTNKNCKIDVREIKWICKTRWNEGALWGKWGGNEAVAATRAIGWDDGWKKKHSHKLEWTRENFLWWYRGCKYLKLSSVDGTWRCQMCGNVRVDVVRCR